MGFDTKTLWMALAISNLIFGLLMLVYARPGGDRAIIRLWAMGQLVKGTGIALIVAKSAFAFPWSFTGNLIYLGGHFLELAAFLSYAGLGGHRKSALAATGGLAAFYLLGIAVYGGNPANGHIIATLFSFCLSVLYAMNAVALSASQRRRSAVQAMLVASNALIAVTALTRAAVAGTSDLWDPQSTQLANQALFIAGYVFSLGDGFGFLLLVKEDSDRDLLRMATIDELTGTASRLAFLEQAEDRRKLCLRTGQPASLIMIDLDHFKAINDSFGHAAGDEVLRAVGRVLHEQLRDVDICGRLGGEEFAVVLPGTGLSAALPVAERLRAGLAEAVVTTGESEIRITASLGIADLGGGRRLEQAMSEADQLLYQAKALGRNRVAARPNRAGASLRVAL